jgi:hypothetical protein
MASQVSHIVYAKVFFDRLEKGEIVSSLGKINRDEFLLGCVFPDIRRIDEDIKRKDTHLRFENIDLDFSSLDAFQAGWKFHLYCDMRREEILNKYNFYSLPNTTDFYNQPAKNLEDELLYDKYNNWEKLVHYFNDPPFVDSGLALSRESFHLWYAMLARYFEKKPSDKSIRTFLVKQSSLVEKLDGIMEKVSELRKNKKVVSILEKVYQEIV